jgi:NADPH:quinone reductase-like Zn-dependent oxidoreductase
VRAVRAGGTISLIGLLSGGMMGAALGPIVTRNVRLQGVTVGSADDFAAMARAVTQHQLHPVIDQVFGFADLLPGLQYMASGRHFGKICIQH